MAEITKVWIVRGPTDVSEPQEVVFEYSVGDLPNLIIGTGAAAWERENTKLYMDRASAFKDAKARWEKKHGKGTWNPQRAVEAVRSILRKAEAL